MEHQQIRQKYINNDLAGFQLKSVSDLKKVHDIDLTAIKGFKRLSEINRDLFTQFLINFLNRWGLDARNSIKPESVKIISSPTDGSFLRFDYSQYGRKGWLHVKSPTLWY